jgi:predicted metalloprotease with PDZ domain
MRITYIISSPIPAERFVHVTIQITGIEQETILLQQPAWRPGRYELGNFAKNTGMPVVVCNQQIIRPVKISKDCWKVSGITGDSLEFRYTYYAAELNAGSTFTSDNFLYVNPVNCLMYIPGTENSLECSLKIKVPSEYKLALATPSTYEVDAHVAKFKSFHHLADSPFIASPKLEKLDVPVQGVSVECWFNGEYRLDREKLVKHFQLFVEYQNRLFDGVPVQRYLFLFHFLPVAAYHGVEHQDSTVIVLGPSYALMQEYYTELLGISSHEYFHTWNIKAIRPAEMQPYNYTAENYFKTGYVAEGVTTYMGDIILLRSGVLTWEWYETELNKLLQRYYENPARLKAGVAESSFDLWLDGYVPGVPGRKVSIYNEGALMALITDIKILQNTDGKAGLERVMQQMYKLYGTTGNGYTASDYMNVLQEISGMDFNELYNECIEMPGDYTSYLTSVLNAVGIELISKQPDKISERNFGLRTVVVTQGDEVKSLAPGSVASGVLSVGDIITGVNGYNVQNNLDRWLEYFQNEVITLQVLRAGVRRDIQMQSDGNTWFNTEIVSVMPSPSQKQAQLFNIWTNRK